MMGGSQEDEGDEARLCRGLAAVVLEQTLPEDNVRIVVDQKVIQCSRALLQKQCKYFEALFAFESEKQDVELKGGILYDVVKVIVDAISADKNDAISFVSADNAQDILLGSAFLQCELTEKLSADFYLANLSLANALSVLTLALGCGSTYLAEKADDFYKKHASSHLFQPKSTASLLRLDLKLLEETLQCVTLNVTAFHLMIGWTAFDMPNRQKHLRKLLKGVMVELVDDLSGLPEVMHTCPAWEKCSVKREHYRGLSLKEKVLYWLSRDHNHWRWPKMPVVCSTGNTAGSIVCKLNNKWSVLTVKPQRLRASSAGSRMCYINHAGDASLYIIGGDGNRGMWKFDIRYDSWKVLSREQDERVRPCVAVHSGIILVFGGYAEKARGGGTHFLETAEAFDPETQHWRPLCALDSPRCGGETFVHCDKVYIFGGLNDRRQAVTQCVAYSPDDDEYEHVTLLPQMIVDFGLVLVDDTVFLVGGMDALTLDTKRCVLSFNVASRMWSPGFPSMNVARKSCACFYDGVHLWAVGGCGAQLDQLSSCERFSFENNRWEMMPNLPKGLTASMNSVLADVPVRLMDDYKDLGLSNVRIK